MATEAEESSQRRNLLSNESITTNYNNIIPQSEEEEESFYASKNIQSTKSYYTSPSTSLPLFTRSWQPLPPLHPRALIFMVHGYGNDISWTFQSTPIFLAQHNFSCFAIDLPGHGHSHGLRAFIPNLDPVLHDLLSYFTSIKTQHKHLPCFLFGESMGAAICLLIHLKQHYKQEFSGIILVAPMCKISNNIRPRWPIPQILTFIARFFPTLPIVPTADLVEKSVKVEEKRVLAARNPMRYKGKPRLGTVTELLRVTDDLSRRLEEVSAPFIVLHGSVDVVTDPDVSRMLYAAARSEDKTIKIYEGMMHSLLFGETDENVDLVRGDILEWLNHRCGGGSTAGTSGN